CRIAQDARTVAGRRRPGAAKRSASGDGETGSPDQRKPSAQLVAAALVVGSPARMEEREGALGHHLGGTAHQHRRTAQTAQRRMGELEVKWRTETLDSTEQILLATAFQDAGRFEDALRVCGVGFPEEITRLLNAESFRFSRGGDWPPASAYESRKEKLRRTLWE